jgi:hypothetical protein
MAHRSPRCSPNNLTYSIRLSLRDSTIPHQHPYDGKSMHLAFTFQFTSPLSDGNVLPNAYDDAAVIRGKLEVLIEKEDKNVLVLAHSYGGRAASEAADQRFSVKEREKEGKKGGLLGIFNASAFPLPVGKSMLSFGEGTTIPGFTIHVSFNSNHSSSSG